MPVIHFTLTDSQFNNIVAESPNQFIKQHVIDSLQLGHCETSSATKRTSKETQASIIAAYADGLSIDYLSKKYSLTRQGIYKILQRHGKSVLKRTLNDAVRLAIYASYENGVGILALQKHYTLSQTTIYNIIKSFNPNAFKCDSRNKEIIAARQLGATVKELTQQFQMSESQIRNIIKKGE